MSSKPGEPRLQRPQKGRKAKSQAGQGAAKQSLTGTSSILRETNTTTRRRRRQQAIQIWKVPSFTTMRHTAGWQSGLRHFLAIVSQRRKAIEPGNLVSRKWIPGDTHQVVHRLSLPLFCSRSRLEMRLPSGFCT